MDNVIFAIDNNTDTHTVAKFMRHVDTQRSMGKLKGNMVQAIGYWEGILEPSYIMTRADYEAHVMASGYVDGQEAVLVAPQDSRQPAHVASVNLKEVHESLGAIREIMPEQAKTANAWTFNMSTSKYFAA
jgi:hypothetical protein